MHPPQIPYLDVALVDKALSLWQSGEVLAMPTETVYGLAADATHGEAVARIYQLKSRPQFNPLIVHVAHTGIARRYVQWNQMADALAAAFWPGPLTLVLKKSPITQSPVSDLVSAGGDTLAIRVPAHPVAQQLLTAWGGAIAAPSANRSGRISPTTAAHVREELGDRIPLIIDGGACQIGIESTVIDCTGDAPAILRAGTITQEMVDEILRRPSSIVSVHSSERTTQEARLLSPGQLASHYAPNAPVRLNASSVAPNEVLLAFGTPLSGAAVTLNLSASGNLLEAAANLFAHLRALDHAVAEHPGMAGIAVMPIPCTGVGIAIHDRLSRAAAPRA